MWVAAAMGRKGCATRPRVGPRRYERCGDIACRECGRAEWWLGVGRAGRDPGGGRGHVSHLRVPKCLRKRTPLRIATFDRRLRRLRAMQQSPRRTACCSALLQAVARWVLASGRGGLRAAAALVSLQRMLKVQDTPHAPIPGPRKGSTPLGPRSCGLRSIRAIRSLVSQGLTNR